MLPLNRPQPKTDLQSLYFVAMQSHNAGDFATAEKQYKAILAQMPNQIDTNFQMGRLLVQTGQAKAGLRYLEKATQLAPATFEFWRVLVETLAGTGMRKQARRSAKRAASNGFALAEMTALNALAERDPSQSNTSLGDAPQEMVDQAVAQYQAGNLAASERSVRELLGAHPQVAFLQNLLGILLMQKGEFAAAGEHFAIATELDPFFPDAFNNLGKAYIEGTDWDKAVAILETALDLAPDHVGANINMGTALLETGKFAEAARLFQKALGMKPDTGECLVGLGRAQRGLGDVEAALGNFRLAEKHFPDGEGFEYCVLQEAECLGDLDREDEKRQRLAEAHDRAPNSAPIAVNLATARNRAGEFDSARDLLIKVLADDPGYTDAVAPYGTITKWQIDDPILARSEKIFADRAADGRPDANLGFALAKAMEDTGQHDRVFGYLDRANAELRRAFVYSGEKVRAEFDAVRSGYSAAFFKKITALANTDGTPIFILGLPRSGTTLTEQIISNHPLVAGGGELGAFSNAMLRLVTDDAGDIAPPDQLHDNDLRQAAAASIEKLKTEYPDAEFVTDKMPHTFVVLGFLASLLPNAKIVHVSRNPVDNCFSIYKNRFSGKGHRYSNNQTELGDYYAMYARLMNHWRELFPNRIVEVDYDQLVADPEARIRELIAGLGLEWHDDCLNTQGNMRDVKTLSIYQARQPIYKSSSRGWKKYERDLAELLDALRAGGIEID